MADLYTPDSDLLQNWLSDTHVEHYLCGDCEGLHINALQSIEGVIFSRIFLQPYGLVFATELDVRPMAVMAIAADQGRLSMDYPTLKIFLDVVDNAPPQLVVTANMLVGSGITPEQFSEFVVTTMEGSRQLADECLRMDYLFAEPGSVPEGESRSIH
jgi:hypothetical protein